MSVAPYNHGVIASRTPLDALSWLKKHGLWHRVKSIGTMFPDAFGHHLVRVKLDNGVIIRGRV